MINIAIGIFLTVQRAGVVDALDLSLEDDLPLTLPAAGDGYVWQAGSVTLSVLRFRATGADTDLAGTVTTAGVVDAVDRQAFEAAVLAAGAIAADGERVTVRILGLTQVEA